MRRHSCRGGIKTQDGSSAALWMLAAMKLLRRKKGGKEEGKEGAETHRPLREVKMRRMEVEKLEKKGC